jgi:hypothetical protein
MSPLSVSVRVCTRVRFLAFGSLEVSWHNRLSIALSYGRLDGFDL